MQGQPLPNTAAAATGMHANQLLIQHGITPNNLGQPQFNNFQQQNQVLQQQAMQKFAANNAQHPRAQMANPNMPKGMPNAGPVPAQGSPMMAQVTEGGAMNNMNEYYAGAPAPMGMRSNGQTGANALQEYQVQLMLLEQHNKKRLIMARDEQDRTARPDGVMLHGQAPFQSMSPQVTRSGQSPTPQDQPKRGTPKMGQAGLPASPLPDGNVPKARGSPAAMGLHPGQVPPGMNPTFVQDMNDLKTAGMPGVMPNGTMIRPPHPAAFGQHAIPPQQMEAYRQQAMRMQTQNWQQMQQGPGGPMMQQPHPPPPPPPPQQQPQQPQGQQPGQQPGQMETPQPRNAMPPPQAPPPANNGGNGRTQPSSPQPPQTAAPPTPQQSNKPNPKARKDAKETTRKVSTLPGLK
jgi:hypothetical protein